MRGWFPVAVLLLGCEPHTQSSNPPTATATATPTPLRPYSLHLPSAGNPSRPAPLVVFLHGYGAPSGELHARALGLESFADAKGFVLVAPDGTVDSRGKRFWNATDACCNFDHAGVDDVGYIAWLLDDVASKASIDRHRVYVVGHSNGGFLAHRLACDLSGRLAAAVSLAGATWKDAVRCAPSQPVSVLQIQGDADDIIRIGGGRVFDLPVPAYPGARDTVATWAFKDGCTGTLRATGKHLDFDAALPGAETTLLAYDHCPAGIDVDLWTVAGGTHMPSPSRAALDAIWSWMSHHARH